MKVYCVFEDDRPERSYLIKIFASYESAKTFIDDEMNGYSDNTKRNWEKYYQIEEWEVDGIKETQYVVEFVSYDGKYPNLCSGNLVLKVNDKEYKFPQYCLSSNGSAYFTNNYSDSHVTSGPWSIRSWPDDFPDGAKIEAEKVVNENVRHGCCGGCL